MKKVAYVVFRYLTNADWFNIYKHSGAEVGGGGQSYIDLPTAAVSVADWDRFFQGVKEVRVLGRAQGPSWTFPIHSIGGLGSQELTVFQRRHPTVCISSQKTESRNANRVYAWLPENGFPAPKDDKGLLHHPPGLVVFMVRTVDDEYWAGWFQGASPCRTKAAEGILATLLSDGGEEGHAGFIDCTEAGLELEENDAEKPFITEAAEGVQYAPEENEAGKTLVAEAKGGVQYAPVAKPARAPVSPDDGEEGSSESQAPSKGHRVPISPYKPKTEEEITQGLFDDDEGPSNGDPTAKTRTQIVRARNTKAVQSLKQLYKGECQITGAEHTFLKKDGTRYCEAHHLIPLGEAGADSAFNIIIVSPLMHRMLHYANVEGIDLGRISPEHTLVITINGEAHTIRWHPKHADAVRAAAKK